jgi:hypothetical protein
MNFLRPLVVLTAIVATTFLGVGNASAATAEECQGKLADLRRDTVTASSAFSNPHSVEGLLAKLDAASGKLTEGKNADASAKLVDYRDTLSTLASAPKPKVDPEVAEALVTESQGVIDCINSIDG